MNVFPIQITNEGVLIPLDYLRNAQDFEFEIRNGNVLVKPKESKEPLPDVKKRFPWVGMYTSKNPTASEDVEDILAAEVDRRSGFTLKPPLEDESE
ncbi:MAG: hypothetical protein DHS20C20_25190 [Ardenticatenaceae bacterium]|nr:MAG: hypothetical protein DHS20C20_25190 [Ardenticatenaceae bacterium]